MKNRIITYRQRIDALLAHPPDGTDWDSVLHEHLTQVSFFQHERLIHLIVTVTFVRSRQGVVCLEHAIYCFEFKLLVKQPDNHFTAVAEFSEHLPDDMVMKIIDGVKAKLTLDGVSKVADALKGVFNK